MTRKKNMWTEAKFKKALVSALNKVPNAHFNVTPSGAFVAGLLDVTGCVNGRYVGLELKIFPGIVSEIQGRELIRIVKAFGYSAVCTLCVDQRGTRSVVVCPTIPNHASGNPIACGVRVDQLNGSPWLQEGHEFRAYELPFVKVENKSELDVSYLVNHIVGKAILKPLATPARQEQSNDGNE